MPQAPSNAVFSRPNGASSLSDNAPRGLTQFQRIERREDGSVWMVETFPKGEKAGPDYSEKRVDSNQDRDLIAKGGTPWYEKFIPKDEPPKAKPSKTKE